MPIASVLSELITGSEEEKSDVLKAYLSSRGRMDRMLLFIEHSTAKDGPRYEKIVLEAIKEKKVPEYKNFSNSTTKEAHKKRIAEEEKERAQFDKKRAAENKADEESSLLQLIQQKSKDRQAKMNSIIDSIEASTKKKSGKKRQQEEPVGGLPSEEEFQKLQEKLFSKKQKKN